MRNHASWRRHLEKALNSKGFLDYNFHIGQGTEGIDTGKGLKLPGLAFVPFLSTLGQNWGGFLYIMYNNDGAGAPALKCT